jgi:hypothetical protein
MDLSQDGRAIGSAEPGGYFGDRGEHTGQVGGRRGNDAQDLSEGCLLLQCLRDLAIALQKLSVALFELGEQSGVLDRDSRLARERLQQRDLLFGERARLAHVRHKQHAERIVAVKQGR